MNLSEPVLQPKGDAILRKVFETDLDKGRYIAYFDLNSESSVGDNIISLGVVIDDIHVARFATTFPKLIESCAEVPFHVEDGTTIKVYAEYPNRNPNYLDAVSGVEIFQLESFDLELRSRSVRFLA